MKVAVLATDGVEQVELDRPWQALEEAGAEPDLVSLDGGTITAYNHIDKGETKKVDAVVSSADPDAYAALVLPGGVINGDFVRADADAAAFVKAFFEAGKPVAAICHAPWVLIEAGVVKGRRMTSWPSLQTDLRNAGAEWVDEEVVIDGNLITSRSPDDLDAFSAAIIEEFAKEEEPAELAADALLAGVSDRRATRRPARWSAACRRRRGRRAAVDPPVPDPAVAATHRPR
jgi:protease I